MSPRAPKATTHEFGARRARRIGALLVGAIAALTAAPARPDGAPTAIGSDATLAELCGIVETAARREGLPVNFFTRLIWRESAFQSRAVSPAGAEGVAQFMPQTASERGLADPFDPAAAIPASAQFLALLAQRLGNLGLAAAAYNAGPDVLVDWLAGKGVLPLETQEYVLSVTGHGVDEWRGPNPPGSAAPDADKSCLTLVGDLRADRGPGSALGPMADPRRRNYSAIGRMQLLRLAADANMTPGAYVLLSLKDSGLEGEDGHSPATHNGRRKRPARAD